MRARFIVIAATAALAACSQAGSDNSAANTTASAAAPAKKHPTYCFFKDAATKGWTASVDATGNVAVKGQAKVDDKRYRGDLSQNEVAGDTASVWLTMAPNTSYSDEDNWWDVAITVPDSGAVKSVTVLCGKKAVAELKVPRN